MQRTHGTRAVGADPRCGEAKGRVWAGGVPRHLTRPLQSHTRRVWCRSSAACAAHFLGFLALLCHGGTEHPVAPCGHPGLGAAAAFPASPRQPHQKQRAEREGKSQLRLPKEQEKHREEPSLALLFPHATNKQSTKHGKQPRAAFGTKWVLRPRKQQWGQNPLVCKRGLGPVWAAVERSRMRPSGLMMRCMGREGSPGDPQTRSLVHGWDHDRAPAPAPGVLLGTETPEEIHRVNCNSRGHPGAHFVPRSLATSVRVRGRFAPAWQLAGGQRGPWGLGNLLQQGPGSQSRQPLTCRPHRADAEGKMHGRFMQHHQKIHPAKSCYSAPRNTAVFPLFSCFVIKC